MSLSDVNTAMTAAQAALDAADYAAAILYGTKAAGYLAALPDSQSGDHSLSWDRSAIDNFVARCRTLHTESQSTTCGVQRSKIVHTRTSASS